jgi:GH35 family endo-1,4-beta-xylanase
VKDERYYNFGVLVLNDGVISMSIAHTVFKPVGVVFAMALVFTAGMAEGAALTAEEINQIESEFGITLSSNEIAQVSAVVFPTNSAQWRADAYSRIETNRKANLNIQVVDMNGDPVEGAKVAVKMKSNDFKFGGTFSAKDFADVGGVLNMSTADYKQRLLSLFNAVGLNNGFKPKLTGIHSYLPAVTNWTTANNLPLRGHLLIWPGGGDVATMDDPGSVSGVDYGRHLSNASTSSYASYNVLGAVETYKASSRTPADKAALKAVVDAEIAEWAANWNVYEWDVINETLSNQLLMEILGEEEMAEWFKIATTNKVSADTKLLINEFQIISAMSESRTPGWYTDRRDRYMAKIDQIISDGGQVDRIGFQSRIKHEHRDPQLIYDRLEEWGNAYGKEMVGTEFEVVDSASTNEWKWYIYTEDERAQITEEMMTQYFSHPLVTGFFGWNTINDDIEALVDYSGNPTVHGLVWYYLHRIRYNTDATLASSLDGKTGLRAFKGEYDVTVSYKGQDYASVVTHTNDQSIVITLTSSSADDPNTSEVVDAWHYHGLTNGAGLAAGVSTGMVGGVFFGDTDLASIQNETVRWQSDGITDSIYPGKDLSSYDGASNGLFQLSVDFLDADFSASAAVSNGSGRVNYGFRNDPGGSNDDAYFRLAFTSGGGSNALYRLEVRDAADNNKNVATFPGTTLDHLSVRAVYDLDNDTYDVYYRHDGAGEVLAHSGTLAAGFALDQLRQVVQTFNGGVNWQAGDQVFTDNLVVRKLGDPPPPPSEIVIDGWDFEGLTNAGLSEAKSYGVTGGAFFGDADPVSVDGGVSVWTRFDVNDANESVFRTEDPSSEDGSTSGVYQVEWDVVSADFANTDASNKSANVGFGLRSKIAGNEDVAFRLRYDGTANEFLVQLTDANGNNQSFASSAIAGNALSNLMIRMVVDLDNRGSAGSVKLYYTPDGGSEVVLTEAGLASATFQMDQYRYAVQSSNGGTDWQLGDVVTTDNLIISRLTASAGDTPESLLADWLADYPTLGSATNLTDNPDLDIANNLAEYAFGGDPTNGSVVGHVPSSELLEDGGTNYIEYVYTKRKDSADRGLSYTLELSSDLVSNIWTNDGYIVTGSNDVDSAFQTITNRVPAADMDNQFIRLQIKYQ